MKNKYSIIWYILIVIITIIIHNKYIKHQYKQEPDIELYAVNGYMVFLLLAILYDISKNNIELDSILNKGIVYILIFILSSLIIYNLIISGLINYILFYIIKFMEEFVHPFFGVWAYTPNHSIKYLRFGLIQFIFIMLVWLYLIYFLIYYIYKKYKARIKKQKPDRVY